MHRSPFLLLLLVASAGSVESREPFRVICFGDSTTAPRESVTPYCELLSGRYAQPGVEFLNRGVRGNTTADARVRFASDVLDAKPGLVIIQFGINDSSVDVWKEPPSTRPRVELAAYEANLNYFVDTLRSSNVRVVLMTFNPLTWSVQTKKLYAGSPYRVEEPDGFNAGRSVYLDAVRSLARKKNIPLVDADALFRALAARYPNGLDSLLLDGIHPNAQGHTIVFEALAPLIEEYVGSTRSR